MAVRSMESSKNYREDARGMERTIAELEDRIRVLENELRLKHGPVEESLQLMRYILDQAQDEASLAGPDGRFYYVNDAKCRSLGYTREELLSMHVWDVDSDSTEEKWASVWQDIRDHGFKMFETWHRTKHGQLFRAEISATYFDFDGREYLCAFVRDITERKRMEEALQKSEEWLRLTCSAGRIGLYEWNVDRGHIYFSPEAYELYGCEPGSPVTYEEWLPCVHPEDRGMAERRFVENQKNARRKPGFSSQIEYRVVHDDGTVLWIGVQSTYDLEGGDLIVRGAVRDITERKQVEDALKKSEERYRELVENANSIILRFDARGNLTFFNEYAEKLFGYSKDEALGRDVVDTIVPLSESTGRDLNDMMEDMKRCPERYQLNVNENVCKNGDRVWIAWTNKAIYDKHGNVVEILSVGNDVTEQKRADEALRESEEKLRLAIDGAQMGMWDWNIEADVLVWSDRCKQIAGVPPDKAIDYGVFLNSIHPDDRERINRTVKEALANREDYDVDIRIPWHDGTVHWAACRGRGLYDKAGKAVRMIGMAMDITEHKRAVEALRVSEERLRRASSAGRIGLYEWNEDQELVYFSPEAYELFGCDPDYPVTSKKFFSRVHPDDLEMFRRSSAEAREKAHNGSSGSAQREFRVVHEGGAVLWLEATAMYDLEGGDLMVRGAVRDITERKLAEGALRESERNLARAQAISHIGNWHIDPATEVCSGSDELFRILSIPRREEFSYFEFAKLVHPDDRAKTRAYYDETRQKHKQSTFDFRIVRPDGEERTIYLDGEFTVDEKGRPHMFGTMQDITERKLAEEALANAKAQAELYVDLMGHDINNFNLVARGYLELIDGMMEDGELKELISRPMEAIDSSSRLIRNVQKLQRARSGGNHLEVLDLGALVGEVAGQFKTLSGDMSVNITCDAIKGVRVRANELLRDVFVNLIGNAIKHSAVPAYINIRVVQEEKDSRRYCKVTIDDNGPGVPDDMKEKIFNRLSRGNTKAKGSGLGLYLVKALVESYGGRVWVEGRVPGDHTKGARFMVILPSVNE